MNTRKTVTHTIEPKLFKEIKIQLIKNETSNLSQLIEDLLREWLTKQK